MNIPRLNFTNFSPRALVAVIISCCMLLVGCRQQFAANDLPEMKRELDAIVQEIGMPTIRTEPTIAKDAVASVGVDYEGRKPVALVIERIKKAAANQGYGRTDSKLKRTGGASTLTFCHNQYTHRFITWTTFQDATAGELLINSEGFKAGYADCSTAH